MNKSIGVIGLGMVGKTYYDGFKMLGYNVLGYDKFKESDVSSIKGLFSQDCLMLCLPTLCSTDGSIDLSAYEEVLPQLKDYNGFILIRSTFTPGTTNALSEKYGLELVHCPEFLREKDRVFDFFKQSRIIIGTKNGYISRQEDLEDFCDELFKPFTSTGTPLYYTDCVESEIAKMASNAFLATKVIFANEMDVICKYNHIRWKTVKNLLMDDPRIAAFSHMDVSEQGGYSGACLPKDVEQLITDSASKGYNPVLLSSVHQANKIFRGQK